MLERNRNDADVIRALNILKQKNQHSTFLILYSIPRYSTAILFPFNIIEIEEHERLSSIDSPIESDNKCGGSDVTNGEDAKFVGDNADNRIDPTSKIALHGMSQLNIDKTKTNLDFKQRMHRVIPIKVNKKTA